MKRSLKTCLVACVAGLTALMSSAPAHAVTNLASNPGFFDFDMVDGFGDSWGAFGAAGFNEFFGVGNPHASLFSDTFGNFGGVFQVDIPGVAGATYQLDALDTRIESAFSADFYIGLEYYVGSGEDEVQLRVDELLVNTAERLANGSTDGNVFSFQGDPAPVGTQFVRPIFRFDNVNPDYFVAEPQSNLFIFDSFLSEVPAPGGELLKNAGFDTDVNADGVVDDVWGSFGNVSFDDFFGGNRHASLFGDNAGNSGGFFQQSILVEEGDTYRFTLEDVRVEDNWDADLNFGIEYFGSDDFNKLGEEIVLADTSTTGDGLSFTMTATAPAGAVYARPIFLFDNVNETYSAQSQAGLFVFDTSLVEVDGTSLPGDANGDGSVDLLDLDILGQEFGMTGADLQADFNDDEIVDLLDLDILGQNFGAGSASAVPEPSALLLVGMGVLAVGRSRSERG